jgi:hypothetical protein
MQTHVTRMEPHKSTCKPHKTPPKHIRKRFYKNTCRLVFQGTCVPLEITLHYVERRALDHFALR